ncbi:protein NO VEIN domain-containing protein [Archangium gephyra]|uniref:protein NO VEIN domain-containing protein n=1 Tax=Archangium gephyra TaxID=48 RepID=UPI003B80AB21
MARNEFFKPRERYRNRGSPSAPDDQFMRWINRDGSGMENGPGIRPLRYFSQPSFTELPAFLVLLTTHVSQGGSYKPWEDIVEPKQGWVLYWGDAKLKPGKHYTEFRGNRILESVWKAVKAGKRDEVPPILHFVKDEMGWVRFTGLCALTALWSDRFDEDGQRVENYRCRLRILGSDPVPVEWLHARREARTLLEAQRGAPEMWTAWLSGSRPAPPVELDAEAMDVPAAADASRPSGQGFSTDSRTRKAVELHAMQRAREYFQSQGFTSIEDVSSKRPFDLLARNSTSEVFIEVKGTQSAGSSVFLTSGEVEFARRNKGRMALYVLHSIQVQDVAGDPLPQGGVHTVFWPWDVDGGALAPIKYVYGLP